MVIAQSSRGSTAARANVQSRTRSCSILASSAERRIALGGSGRISYKLSRCWVAS